MTYLAEHGIPIPPDVETYCTFANTVIFISFLASTLLIVSMTFDRFYSIVKPHKAASFNTVKRAKITIASIVILSIIYNSPHMFITSYENWQCLPYAKGMEKSYGQFYYWLSFLVHYVFPFLSLLTMNSVIIHKLRNRTIRTEKRPVQENADSQTSKPKNTEIQLVAILLSVTFGFMILTTPGQLLFLYIMSVDIYKTPYNFASYYLFYAVAQKLYFSNHGINFFLYVISGQKFRADLVKLFQRNRKSSADSRLWVSSSADH